VSTETPLDLGELADQAALLLITVKERRERAVLVDLDVLSVGISVTDYLITEPSVRLALRTALPGQRILTRIERRGPHPYVAGIRSGDAEAWRKLYPDEP
jgi:hypothetical protein